MRVICITIRYVCLGTDDLLEKGISVKCNNLVTLPVKISKLSDDAAGMAQMKRQVLRFPNRTLR